MAADAKIEFDFVFDWMEKKEKEMILRILSLIRIIKMNQQRYQHKTRNQLKCIYLYFSFFINNININYILYIYRILL